MSTLKLLAKVAIVGIIIVAVRYLYSEGKLLYLFLGCSLLAWVALFLLFADASPSASVDVDSAGDSGSDGGGGDGGGGE